MSPDALEVRRHSAWSNPRRVVELLGLAQGAKPAGGGWLVRCPWHPDRTPSCSVTRGPDGTVRAKCHACGGSGDVLGLLGGVLGLDQFPDILAEARRRAGIPADRGHHHVRGREAATQRPVTGIVTQVEPPKYPPPSEVRAAWDACRPLGDDAEACSYLRGRALDPVRLEDLDLMRVLPSPSPAIPILAKILRSYRLRLALRVFDAQGRARSLRGWRIDGDGAKRMPPGGYAAAGLVLADPGGLALLRGIEVPRRVVIVEGEPDLCTWACSFSEAAASAPAVLGITGCGSWTDAVAARVPAGAQVIIRTDPDDQGDRYAEHIAATLRERCQLFRPRRAVA